MKNLFSLFLVLIALSSKAQEKNYTEPAEDFISVYQGQISGSKTSFDRNRLIGRVISNKSDTSESLYLINSKYYLKTDRDRKTLGVFKFITIKGIPLVILLDNRNKMEGCIAIKNEQEYWVKYDRFTNLETYGSVQNAQNDAEYLIDNNNVYEINYRDPKVILYVKNGKIGIKSTGKNIIDHECDSLDVYFKMAIIYNSGKASLFNVNGKLLTDQLKTLYKYSEQYYQVIDLQNKMYFIDTSGVMHSNPEVQRFLRGNDTNPRHVVNYYAKNNKIFKMTVTYRGHDEQNKSDDMDVISDLTELMPLEYFFKNKKEYLNELSNHYKSDLTGGFVKIPKGYKRAIFVNNKTKISAEHYWYNIAYYKPLKPNYLIAKAGNKYGMWDMEEEKIIIPFNYKRIIPKVSHLYLENGGLCTYYPYIGLIPKYKYLEDYKENYARFEYPDGKKGWVDRKGVEYFD